MYVACIYDDWKLGMQRRKLVLHSLLCLVLFLFTSKWFPLNITFKSLRLHDIIDEIK